jgi:uncharacterized coiled-coil protein SlyX
MRVAIDQRTVQRLEAKLAEREQELERKTELVSQRTDQLYEAHAKNRQLEDQLRSLRPT